MTYASTVTNRPGRATGRSPVFTAIARAVGYLVRLRQIRSNRREVERLARLDDRMLADIGLLRADVDWALMQHWSVDPSHALAERSFRRKQAARWAREFQAK